MVLQVLWVFLWLEFWWWKTRWFLFCFVLFFWFWIDHSGCIIQTKREREKERKRERKRDLVRGGINGEDRVTERKESEDTSLREKRKITNKANSV